jgi:hypothetical protein
MRFVVVEVGAEEIVLREGSKWVRFTQHVHRGSDGTSGTFALTVDGMVMLDGKMDEMDFAAERITRELMHSS